MAVYQASPEVMQRSLTMTHTFLNLGLGYVPIPVLSEEHYAELMDLYVENMSILEAKADPAPPNKLELADDMPEDAEIVDEAVPATPSEAKPAPIPSARKRKPLKTQSEDTGVNDASDES